jgi:hypothetical protein
LASDTDAVGVVVVVVEQLGEGATQTAGGGGATVAVFVAAPLAVAVIVALTVTETVPLAGTVQLVDTLPLPLAGAQPVAVQVWNVTSLGAVSCTTTFLATTLALLLTASV